MKRFIKKAVKRVDMHIGSFDIDEKVGTFDSIIDDKRVIVTFSNFQKHLSVTSAFILDENWETLKDDSKIFLEEIDKLVNEINKELAV